MRPVAPELTRGDGFALISCAGDNACKSTALPIAALRRRRLGSVLGWVSAMVLILAVLLGAVPVLPPGGTRQPREWEDGRWGRGSRVHLNGFVKSANLMCASRSRLT
jgi:hypothetical protein